VNGIEGVPEEHRETIKTAIRKRYPDEAETIFKDGYWNGLSSYFGFYCNKMFLGCETDGYIHS
jgi:hypothetical protein